MLQDAFQLLIQIAIAGTGAAAVITWFGNWVIKRREEYIDMSKYKIDSISRSKDYFIQLARYYGYLSSVLNLGHKAGTKKIDSESCLYYIANILSIHKTIFDRIGDLQLDDLEAEKIIVSFSTYVTGMLNSGLGEVSLFTLVDIIREKNRLISLPEFSKKLSQCPNNQIKTIFQTWIQIVQIEKWLHSWPLIMKSSSAFHMYIFQIRLPKKRM